MVKKQLPTLTVLVGLPASGKTTYTKDIKENSPNSVVLSSDEIRGKLLGSVQDQSNNEEVFNHLYMVMQSNLLTFNNVVIDATNITRKTRAKIFERLRNIPCKVIAVVFATPYSVCLERNKNREKSVPERVIERMYKGFQFPQKFEGFDEIIIQSSLDFVQSFNRLVELNGATICFDQKSNYHSLTLDEHMEKVASSILTLMKEYPLANLFCAAKFHDVGKPIVQTWNEEKQVMNYYGHENVGAYEMMVCSEFLSFIDIEEVLFYIGYHMLPYSFVQEKTQEKYKKLFGDELFNNLILLNLADREAH